MRYALLPVLLAVGVASCDSTKPTNPLTERETIAVLQELVWLTGDEIDGTSTVDCSVGGETTVTATGDEGENRDSTWVSARWTIVPADCEMNVVNDTLTLNGKPNVRLTTDAWIVVDDDFEVVKGEARIVVGGAMTWRRRDGDSDTCSVDLTFESTEFDDDDGFTGDFTGRMCGLDLVIDIVDLMGS